MRIWALCAAIVLLGLALVPRNWGSERMDGEEPYLSLGLRDYEVKDHGGMRVEQLGELHELGAGFAHEGAAAFYCGIAAVIACILGVIALRKDPADAWLRFALLLPLLASLVTTLLFWGRLSALQSLDTGPGPLAMAAALLVAATALVWPRAS